MGEFPLHFHLELAQCSPFPNRQNTTITTTEMVWGKPGCNNKPLPNQYCEQTTITIPKCTDTLMDYTNYLFIANNGLLMTWSIMRCYWASLYVQPQDMMMTFLPKLGTLN